MPNPLALSKRFLISSPSTRKSLITFYSRKAALHAKQNYLVPRRLPPHPVLWSRQRQSAKFPASHQRRRRRRIRPRSLHRQGWRHLVSLQHRQRPHPRRRPPHPLFAGSPPLASLRQRFRQSSRLDQERKSRHQRTLGPRHFLFQR